MLHGETLLFLPAAIVATVADEESGSTFRETSLATEIKRKTKPTMLHIAKPAEASLVSHKFHLQFQGVTAASITFF